jgi:hypothetical protein
VLANLCAVIARELRAGEEPSARDAELFSRLSGTRIDGAREAAADLAAAIRRGDLDERLSETIAGLREHVRRKLEISRPGYAD